jgi:hypothetical protein
MIHPTPKRLIDLDTHEKTSLEQFAVLTYEIGDLAKMLTYVKRYAWVDSGHSKAYKKEAELAMSDTLAQLVLMCQREGWDFWHLARLGQERMREKVERHRELGE